MTKQEADNINRIYQLFFQKRNCVNIQLLYGRNSRLDALYLSGSSNSEVFTNILVEYKDRRYDKYGNERSVAAFDSGMVEAQKIKSMKRSMLLFDCPSFLMMEFMDIILVWEIDRERNYEVVDVDCPATTMFENKETVKKPNVFLPYNEAIFIIDRKTYRNGTFEELEEYINFTRYEHNS